MNNVFLVLNLVAILFIWHDTDAIAEWSKLFRLKFMKYEEFEKNKASAFPCGMYSEFIACQYGSGSFIIRLITCPVCFSVWCNVLLTLLFIQKSPANALGANIVLTWVVYHLVKLLVKKANE